MKNKKVIYIYWKLWCYYIIQISKKKNIYEDKYYFSSRFISDN